MFTSLDKESISIWNLQMDKEYKLIQQVVNQQTCLRNNMMPFKMHWTKWDLLKSHLHKIDIAILLKKSHLIIQANIQVYLQVK